MSLRTKRSPGGTSKNAGAGTGGESSGSEGLVSEGKAAQTSRHDGLHGAACIPSSGWLLSQLSWTSLDRLETHNVQLKGLSSPRKSAEGLVSRSVAGSNGCAQLYGDEGRPFGFGDKVADARAAAGRLVKSHGGERCGNVGTMIPAGTVESNIYSFSYVYRESFQNGSRSRASSRSTRPRLRTSRAGLRRPVTARRRWLASEPASPSR